MHTPLLALWLGACGADAPTTDAPALRSTAGPATVGSLHRESLTASAVFEQEPPHGVPNTPLTWPASEGWQLRGPSAEASAAGPGLHIALTDVATLTHDLGGLRPGDWAHAEVRLKTSSEGLSVALGGGPATLAISDGKVHTYNLINEKTAEGRDPSVLRIGAPGTAALTFMGATWVPRGHGFPDDWGVQLVDRDDARVRALVARTPSTLSVPIVVPPDARLDLALGPSRDGDRLTYTIRVGGQVLLDAQVVDGAWVQRSMDLGPFAGQSITLSLSADSERPGAVAMWGAPTLTAAPPQQHPNIILYVIDGGGADYMSLYGYGRDTTPNLSKIATEGTLFELAHTTSGWTKPSTASFLSSLHHSALGGYTTNSDAIPGDAHPLAERAHDAGYQTATFTSNPFAGSLSGLERGVDLFRDRRARENSASSVELHEQFWAWRDDWPGEPYLAHFQTTDVHEPHLPVSPFAGTWVSPERRADFEGWWRALHATPIEHDTVLGKYQRRLDAMGVDRRAFFETQRDLYDETMAHNDHQIGLFVEELKRRGEWERTLLIVTADHGHPAGSFSRFGRGLIDPQPEDWEGALADSYRSHVPLMMFWPGHLPAGVRIKDRVSLIDLLPTVLDLASLPPAKVRQGASLGPALRGEPWTPPPVVLDQFQAHAPSGQMVGHIEVIDGRWAASMEVVPDPLQDDYQANGESLVTAGGWRASRPHRPSTPRVLLYDIEADPLCLRNVNAQYPEELAHYTDWLETRLTAHQELARLFKTEGGAEVNAEQMEALRLLGYVD